MVLLDELVGKTHTDYLLELSTFAHNGLTFGTFVNLDQYIVIIEQVCVHGGRDETSFTFITISISQLTSMFCGLLQIIREEVELGKEIDVLQYLILLVCALA